MTKNQPSCLHLRLACGFALSLSLGCSTFNDKTGLDVPAPANKTAGGALTGAAVGGGLGLIVGSTSGNAGEGMLVGSLAGGALGAGIGAKLDRDERSTQELARDTTVRADEREQVNQLNTLRQENTDTTKSFYDAPVHTPVLSPEKELSSPSKASSSKSSRAQSFSSQTSSKQTSVTQSPRARMSSGDITYLSKPSGLRKGTPFSAAAASSAAPAAGSERISLASVKKTPSTTAAKAVSAVKPVSGRADSTVDPAKPDSFALKPASQKSDASAASGLPPAASESTEPKTEATDAGAKPPKDLANCKDAVKEAERGLHASSDADRLFYLRRAARLCPTEPSYHVELGRLYGTIGKNEDAKYELRQAIDLDPNNQVARDELSIIENAGSVTQ